MTIKDLERATASILTTSKENVAVFQKKQTARYFKDLFVGIKEYFESHPLSQRLDITISNKDAMSKDLVSRISIRRKGMTQLSDEQARVWSTYFHKRDPSLIIELAVIHSPFQGAQIWARDFNFQSLHSPIIDETLIDLKPYETHLSPNKQSLLLQAVYDTVEQMDTLPMTRTFHADPVFSRAFLSLSSARPT